jgi:3',5'-cyclic AMP phosphodiesterase CpdA
MPFCSASFFKISGRQLIFPFLLLLVACSRGQSVPESRAFASTDGSGAPTFVVNPLSLPKKLKIIAYGDIRFMDPAEKVQSHPAARRAIVAKVAQEKPDALLITGDLPHVGASPEDWAIMHNETTAWRDAHLRLYPTLGNHEFAGGVEKGLENWWTEFPDFKNRRWYSVQFANCYFIALDSDTSLDEDSLQGKWLSAQLAHLPPETDFVFLEMHHPPYTDSIELTGHSAREQEKKLGRRLEALQPSLRARLIVVAGHVHNYERFVHGDVTYLVSGGGGAAPYLFSRSKDDFYRGGRAPTFHYVTFMVDGNQLKATMTKLMNPESESNPQWQEKDSFQLSAPAKK